MLRRYVLEEAVLDIIYVQSYYAACSIRGILLQLSQNWRKFRPHNTLDNNPIWIIHLSLNPQWIIWEYKEQGLQVCSKQLLYKIRLSWITIKGKLNLLKAI